MFVRNKNELKNKPSNLTPIFTVEGGLLIEDDLNRIEALYNDGIRALTLTWNGENQIAGGADTNIGLKNFGTMFSLWFSYHLVSILISCALFHELICT